MIVDANVAIYWCVETPLSKAAKPIAERADLRAPGLIRLETTSALLKYLRSGQIGDLQFHESFGIIEDAITEFFDDARLLKAATAIAVSQSHKIYDCLYLALAVERNEPLATADRRLAAVAETIGVEAVLLEPA
jgi:predicted nucleic acid-binding protein